MSPEELDQSQVEGGGQQTLDNMTVDPNKGAEVQGKENLILGRFQTEQEAREYIESLESKKEAEDQQAALDQILKFREEESQPLAVESPTPISQNTEDEDDDDTGNVNAKQITKIIREEVQRAVNPIQSQMRESQDLSDAHEIMKFPNYNKYLAAAHLQYKRSAGSLTLLGAFKSVYDPSEFQRTKTQTLQQEKTPEQIAREKQMAQVETAQALGGKELATANETETLKKELGYGAENMGRKV